VVAWMLRIFAQRRERLDDFIQAWLERGYGERFLEKWKRSTYHAVQHWEEARRTLTEAAAMAETLDLGRLRTPALSQSGTGAGHQG
jgi:hypothetical protein